MFTAASRYSNLEQNQPVPHLTRRGPAKERCFCCITCHKDGTFSARFQSRWGTGHWIKRVSGQTLQRLPAGRLFRLGGTLACFEQAPWISERATTTSLQKRQ